MYTIYHYGSGLSRLYVDFLDGSMHARVVCYNELINVFNHVVLFRNGLNYVRNTESTRCRICSQPGNLNDLNHTFFIVGQSIRATSSIEQAPLNDHCGIITQIKAYIQVFPVAVDGKKGEPHLNTNYSTRAGKQTGAFLLNPCHHQPTATNTNPYLVRADLHTSITIYKHPPTKYPNAMRYHPAKIINA
jgi:hypothetical protein